jgi:hypothetical protein
MKRQSSDNNGRLGRFRPAWGESCCELLILADGTVLAQNLTDKLAAILSRVAPHDTSLKQRAFRRKESRTSNSQRPTSNLESRSKRAAVKPQRREDRREDYEFSD